MSESRTSWNIVVSRDTDIELRKYLASRTIGPEEDLSHFVEEAVRAHLIELTAREAKAENATRTQAEIDEAIEEALNWARQ